MLTGVSPRFAGLAALPDVHYWVVMDMIDAGITSLTDLSTSAQYASTINIGLLETLRQQAERILENYGSEDALLASFTERFPVVGKQTESQMAA